MRKTFRFVGLMLMTSLSYGLISCGSDGDDEPGISITPASVSMHYDDTQQLKADGATSWTVNDDFVAKVDGSGLVTARHIGTTQVIASNGKKSAICEVTVTPEYDLFDNPIFDWGASESSISSKESHAFLRGSDNILFYDFSKNSTSCILGYSFKNGGLSSINAILNYSDYAKAGNYLIERYQPIGEDDGMFVFLDALTKDKAKTLVGLTTMKLSGSTVTSIIFMSASTASNSGLSISNVLNEQMKNIEIVK